MKEKKILEVHNVNDSLIFIWGDDNSELINFKEYNNWSKKQKKSWKTISKYLIKL